MGIIKWILIYVCSGDIGLTGSGNRKSILRSVKTGPSQFVLKQMTQYNNDCEEYQNSFAKHLQELANHQYSSRVPNSVQHHTNLRTSIV